MWLIYSTYLIISVSLRQTVHLRLVYLAACDLPCALLTFRIPSQAEDDLLLHSPSIQGEFFDEAPLVTNYQTLSLGFCWPNWRTKLVKLVLPCSLCCFGSPKKFVCEVMNCGSISFTAGCVLEGVSPRLSPGWSFSQDLCAGRSFGRIDHPDPSTILVPQTNKIMWTIRSWDLEEVGQGSWKFKQRSDPPKCGATAKLFATKATHLWIYGKQKVVSKQQFHSRYGFRLLTSETINGDVGQVPGCENRTAERRQLAGEHFNCCFMLFLVFFVIHFMNWFNDRLMLGCHSIFYSCMIF